ncbi:hypothetical protein H310_00443 [Aphanomyces invadans]|uniref:Uncharacterized protein n=1 Tax=Aphanomyces invadans TaxID=157072 RepID=A0A024UVS2_9STRA|nr:hypothetical protein H310_00443 [Aphanomyces invadans]ETW10055.1 hypothetical protein H310_00443 [Aphanomyces invadans]|eukprot:XP_008861466.1 hypothetical protein H310_00443 [Aphanomyces invadans]
MAGMNIHKTFLKRAVSSQKLRAVVVDYEALCKSTAAPPTPPPTPVQDAAKLGEPLADVKRGSLLSNVRGLLNSMTQSETEQGRRVQTTLAGLPSFMRATILGEDVDKNDKEGEDDTGLHDKLVGEIQRKTPVKSSTKGDVLAFEDESSSDGVRAKYLAKMNALKQRAKLKSLSKDSPADVLSRPEPAACTNVVASAGNDTEEKGGSALPKRKVNEHTNVFLSYISLRGLSLGVIPPTSPHRREEFQQFVDEMDYLDAVMEAANTFPMAAPVVHICDKLGVAPKDAIVISGSHAAISSGRAAGAYTCFVPNSPNEVNHDSDYTIPNLREFKYIVEELNGISWRN